MRNDFLRLRMEVGKVILAGLLLLSTAEARRVNPYKVRVFVPSHQSLVDQNAEADRLGLVRIADDRALAAMVEREELAPIVETTALKIDKRLPANRRYARPWVVAFLNNLSADYYKTFGAPLQLNSAVRTIKFQRRLRLWNRNAARPTGQLASVHLAGIAIDLQRRGLTVAQLRFLQARLLYHSARGEVIVEEELRQPCFHVVVRAIYPVTIPPSDTPVPTCELSLEGNLGSL